MRAEDSWEGVERQRKREKREMGKNRGECIVDASQKRKKREKMNKSER